MRFMTTAVVLVILLAAGCLGASEAPQVLRSLPLDSMEGVLTRSGVSLDPAVSSDGNGSLKIEAQGPTTVRLFEIPGLGIDNARLIYRAKVKAEMIEGRAFLEMWCAFPGMGEYFSRSLDSPITGTVDWSTIETPFFLKRGQKPDLVKLNVLIKGRGTLWIDDISIVKGPLK